MRPGLRVALGLILVGCGASQSALLQRAEIELDCPRERLAHRTVVDAIGTGKTVLVEGCGQRTTYVQMCTGSSGELIRDCAWTH